MKIEQLEQIYAIYVSFSNTEYGQRLAAKVRYEKYNLAKVPNEEWIRLLGVDVNNLAHMLLTYSLTQQFIEDSLANNPSDLSPEEQNLLLIAAIIHDQAESIVGDISFGDKTDQTELEERAAFAAHLELFTPNIAADTKQLIIQANTEILSDTQNRLGNIFNAVERIGYVRTALRASEVLAEGAEPRDVLSGLEWLVADVLSNQIQTLTTYASTYAAVEKYLRAELVRIDAAFQLVSPAIFEQYCGDGAARKISQLADGQKAWDSWK